MSPAADQTGRILEPSKRRQRLVPAVAVAAFVWIVLIPSVASVRLALRELSVLPPIGEDVISVQLRRYERVRPHLAGVDRVGYLSDTRETASLPGTWFHPFQVAGHAVCPTLLVDSDAEALVLGDFQHAERMGELLARRGLQIVRSCGDGVFLLRRSP